MRPITIFVIVSCIFQNHSFGQNNRYGDTAIRPPQLPESDSMPVYQQLFCRVIEKEPTFNNGPGDWEKYLRENLNNAFIENDCPPGIYKVKIHFVVKSNGEVEVLKTITNHGFGMESEAIRVICSSPKWIPATRNGRNIAFAHIQPIIFEVCKETPVIFL